MRAAHDFWRLCVALLCFAVAMMAAAALFEGLRREIEWRRTERRLDQDRHIRNIPRGPGEEGGASG